MEHVKYEINDNLVEQPSELFVELVEEPRLCMLLNPKLTKKQVGALTRTFYVVTIEHEGKTRLAVLCGFYQQPRGKKTSPVNFGTSAMRSSSLCKIPPNFVSAIRNRFQCCRSCAHGVG